MPEEKKTFRPAWYDSRSIIARRLPNTPEVEILYQRGQWVVHKNTWLGKAKNNRWLKRRGYSISHVSTGRSVEEALTRPRRITRNG